MRAGLDVGAKGARGASADSFCTSSEDAFAPAASLTRTRSHQQRRRSRTLSKLPTMRARGLADSAYLRRKSSTIRGYGMLRPRNRWLERVTSRNLSSGNSATDYAWFLRISRRSLNEVQDELRTALLKGYVTDADLVPARRLMRRIYPAMSSLLKHLDGHRPHEPDGT